MLGWAELCQHTLLDGSEVRLLFGFRVAEFPLPDLLAIIVRALSFVVSKEVH